VGKVWPREWNKICRRSEHSGRRLLRSSNPVRGRMPRAALVEKADADAQVGRALQSPHGSSPLTKPQNLPLRFAQRRLRIGCQPCPWPARRPCYFQYPHHVRRRYIWTRKKGQIIVLSWWLISRHFSQLPEGQALIRTLHDKYKPAKHGANPG